MTRRGPPGHLTRPSRGAFFLAASENSCHCPLPKSQLASARRANKPTLPNLPTLLPNLPTLSRGLPLPQCLSQQSFSSSRGLSSPSRLVASTCCRLCRFRRRCRFQANAAEADTAAESADTVPRAATAPTVAKPALFRQRVPWTNFPAWPGQPIVQPVFVKKSAVPIFPLAGMAAAAPLSGPTVFSVKPWTVNRPDS